MCTSRSRLSLRMLVPIHLVLSSVGALAGSGERTASTTQVDRLSVPCVQIDAAQFECADPVDESDARGLLAPSEFGRPAPGAFAYADPSSAAQARLAPGQLAPIAGGATPVGTSSSQLAAACQPSWVPTFGGMPGFSDIVYCMATFDDGTGSALYAGGLFGYASGHPASGFAKWDGDAWVEVLTPNTVWAIRSMAVFDDGSGPALFLGGAFLQVNGAFTDRILKWDGTNVSALGSGLGGPSGAFCRALAVFDDGTGPALYAGGDFTTANGNPAPYIARWDGATWSALPSGLNERVDTLFVYNDGTGAALYAGGKFTIAGTTTVNHVAKWDGLAWSALGAGINAVQISTLAAFDDGTGMKLYAGGTLTPQVGIMSWDGVSWSTVGGGTNASVYALTVFDDGSGPALFAGGFFDIAGGAPASGIGKWNGSLWTGVSGGTDYTVIALAVFDDGSGPALAVGGDFRKAGSVEVMRVAKWTGSIWEAMGSGAHWHTVGMAVYDDGAGPALWVTGYSLPPGGSPARRSWTGKWNGSSWVRAPVQLSGPAPDGFATELLTYDDGSGLALYAAGGFSMAGSTPVNRVAKWNGVLWSAVGSGTPIPTFVNELRAFDDGTGNKLYVGCTNSGGIHCWNGTAWTSVAALTGYVYTMCVFDDGTGPALYVGGTFTNVNGVSANNIARWNGTTWNAVGAGLSSTCFHLVVYDDGSGAQLYAGGPFTTAGGVPANYLAKWNGSAWSALSSEPNDPVTRLAVFDMGSGSRLFAAGAFTTVGTTVVSGIAEWDGSNWSAMGSGVPPSVASMFGYDVGQGPNLAVGGAFYLAFDSNDSFIARWACSNSPSGVPFCSGDGSGTACPCGNNGVADHGCGNSAFALGAELSASGVAGASNATDTLILTATEIPGPGLFFQGTGTFSGGAGLAFGDGLLCAGGTIARMGVVFPTGTAASYPGGLTPSPIHVAGTTAPGDVRHYQCWYRDSAAFCASATYNLTQGLTVTWGP